MSDRSCGSCRRDLSAYLDGELSSRRERILSLHLEGCEACRIHLEELRLVSREMGRLDPPPPEDLEAGILRGLEAGLREEAAPGRSPWRAPLLVGASAVVLAAVVGLGLLGLRDLSSFAPPIGPARTEAAAERVDRPSVPTSVDEGEPALEEALPGEPSARDRVGKEKLATRREAAKDIVEGVLDDRVDTDQGTSPRSAPPEEARMQRTAVGPEGKRGEKNEAQEAGDLEAASRFRIDELRQDAAREREERDESPKKDQSSGGAAEPPVMAPERSSAVGMAGAAEGYGLAETGCPGPPVAAPGPGEVLGCPSDAGQRPVRILLHVLPESAVDDDHARDEKSEGSAGARDSRASGSPEVGGATVELQPVPGPLPVPEAAATRILELLLDLRLAADGGVLSVDAIPPAEEGSLEAAVCSSVARWRFRPPIGEGAIGEGRVRLSLRLEPASP